MEIDISDLTKYYYFTPPSQNTIQRKLQQFGMDRFTYFPLVHEQDGKCKACQLFPDDGARPPLRNTAPSKMLIPVKTSKGIVMLCEGCEYHLRTLAVLDDSQAQLCMYALAELRDKLTD